MPATLLDNRYARGELLGSGGMAEVYLAHDEILGRDVALKVLAQKYAENEELVKRFRREARSAAFLNHPYIVSVYDRLGFDGDYSALETSNSGDIPGAEEAASSSVQEGKVPLYIDHHRNVEELLLKPSPLHNNFCVVCRERRLVGW